VEALAAVCPNEGCTWTGTVKEFEVNRSVYVYIYIPDLWMIPKQPITETLNAAEG